jgi:hypothetical protein
MADMNHIQILQLVSRLEDSHSQERIDAIGELSSLVRNNASIIGKHAIPLLYDILRDSSNSLELQDALDLLEKLITIKPSILTSSIATDNVELMLSNANNVNLLLDLLEHTDLTVGVMTSQLLTAIHKINGSKLEQQIQVCPDGMYISCCFKNSRNFFLKLRIRNE